jgi:hypothetical protein
MRFAARPAFAEPLYPGIREALDELRHPEVFLAIATGKARRGLDFTLIDPRPDGAVP